MCPVLATTLASISQVLFDIAVFIGKSAFDPEMLNFPQQSFVFNRSMAFGLIQVGVETAMMKF